MGPDATRGPVLPPGLSLRSPEADELESLRALRLESLADSPAMFHTTHAEAAAWDDEAWRRWRDRGFLVLLDAGGRLRGLAAGTLRESEPQLAHLQSVWVAPEHRGSGAATALVDAVTSWARNRRLEALLLDVTATNARAIRFYERCGFRSTGREVVNERDQRLDLEMRLELGAASRPDSRGAA